MRLCRTRPNFLARAVFLFSMAAICLSSGPASASPSFDEGVAAYKRGNFKAAATLLTFAINQNPSDVNAMYYLALALQQMRDFDGAREQYGRIVTLFPGSQAAGLARQALSVLGRGSSSTVAAATSSRSSAPAQRSVSTASTYDASLPEECRVPFKREHSHLLVDAMVNYKPIKMVFDTGADITCMGKNHLEQLGIPLPTGKPAGFSQGIGDAGAVPFWVVNADIKIGNIIRRNTRIDVQEHLAADPLLGQNFFNDYAYTIDSGDETIHFQRKARYIAGTSKNDLYAVPFKKDGNELIVNAEVNGKLTPMIFDTGASNVVFSFPQIQKLGIEVPPDAEQQISRGIAGNTNSVFFPIRRLRLGPIERSDFGISVVNGMAGPYPLIGQSFLQSWQYTIDNTANVIRFVRR